jgi:hypothetical protein
MCLTLCVCMCVCVYVCVHRKQGSEEVSSFIERNRKALEATKSEITDKSAKAAIGYFFDFIAGVCVCLCVCACVYACVCVCGPWVT